MTRMPPVLWLPVGGDCNCRCEGCPFVKVPPMHREQARLMIENLRPSALVLHGPGEPTLRDDLGPLFEAVRRGGAGSVALVTNGRTLAYPQRAARIADLRPSLVAVTVHHPRREVHDRLTRAPGSHEQTLAGLHNLARSLAGSPTRLVVRTVIRPELYEHLPELARLARRAGASDLWFDGDEDGSLSLRVASLEGAAVRLRWRGAIEALLLEIAPTTTPRTREGAAAPRFHPDERAVSLVVRTGCRNACSFCTTRIVTEHNRASWPLDDLGGFIPALEEGRDRGFDRLRLVAVEPLEHPDLSLLLRRARELGYRRIEAWTSGRALADEAWADELRSAGLTHLDIPLFGPDEATHDEVAGVPGAFAETAHGIARALQRFDVRWHLVLVRQNLSRIRETLERAAEMGLGEPAAVLIPSPSLENPDHYQRFAPRYREVADALAGLPRDLSKLLLHRGIGHQLPPCVLGASLGDSALHDLPAPPRSQLREAGEGEPGAAEKIAGRCPRADECGLAGRCPGVHALHLQVFGDAEVNPTP